MIEGFEEDIERSITLLKEGKHREAFDVFDAILSRDPTSIGTWRAKGEVLWIIEQYDLALMCNLIAEHLRRVDEYPRSLLDKFRRSSEVMTHTCVREFELGAVSIPEDTGVDHSGGGSRFEELREKLLEKLGKDPDDTRVLRQLTLANIILGNNREALKGLDRLLAGNDSDSELREHRIRILLKIGDAEKALGDTERLMESTSGDPGYWELMGDVKSKLKEEGEAALAYHRAFNLDASNVKALFNKAIHLGRTGDLDEAFRIYSKLAVYKRTGKIEPEPEMNMHQRAKMRSGGPEEPLRAGSTAHSPEVQGPRGGSLPSKRIGRTGPGTDTSGKWPAQDPVRDETGPTPSGIPDREDDGNREGHPEEEGPRSDGKNTSAHVRTSGKELRGIPFSMDDRYYIDNMIEKTLDMGGGGSYLYLAPTRMFEFSLLLLSRLAGEFGMGGVVITVEKPASIYLRMVDGPLHDQIEQVPFFVDCVSNISNGVDEDPNVIVMEKYFDMEELQSSIELGLHKAAEKYSGQRFFVMCDNVAAFQYYTSPRTVRKFFNGLGKELEKLHIHGFFMVGDGQLSLQVSDMIRNLPKTLLHTFGKH